MPRRLNCRLQDNIHGKKKWTTFRLTSWCGGPKESHVSQTNALIAASEQPNPQTAYESSGTRLNTIQNHTASN